MNKPIRYVAEPKHVREVTLQGSASPAFWARHLEQEHGLSLAAEGNSARLMIVAAEMCWMGARFCEVSISLKVSHREVAEGFLLLQAFNSNRFFAWSERTFFKTPYAHAQCHASPAQPRLGVTVHGKAILHGEMSSDKPWPLRSGNETWEGPVFLPLGRSGKRRLFFGRFKGETTVFPFTGAATFTFSSHTSFPVLQALRASDFQPEFWVVRSDATHGKSKTYAWDLNPARVLSLN